MVLNGYIVTLFIQYNVLILLDIKYILIIFITWCNNPEFHLVAFRQFINNFSTARLLSLGQGRTCPANLGGRLGEGTPKEVKTKKAESIIGKLAE